MGTFAILMAVLVLNLSSLGMAQNRQYRILNGSPYYTNHYTDTYPPTYDDYVYITDKYGQTSAVRKAAQLRALSSAAAVCSGGTCGQNAHCTIVGDRPVCSCLTGHTGDPLTFCKRSECLSSEECRGHLVCKNDRCVDACDGACGANANCDTRNHVPVCSCPAGHTGDPFSHCRRFDRSELCYPSPCGQNAQCDVVNEVPTCKCLPGYFGSPISGCRHECESDSECGSTRSCVNFKCEDPCAQCGINAECEFVGTHTPVCKCPKGYYGNPYSSCQAECTYDQDCPRHKPACIYNSCKNPCDGACGTGANCELRGLTPVCSCPRDMTGDPFVRCRPFDKSDLCDPNPCGLNAKCQPGYDRTNKERPVCTCITGYTGNPLTGCVRGECTDDSHCADSQACVEYRCQNPCIGQCGVNADCTPRRHLAVCTCPTGYKGDALSQCYQSTGVGRYLRYY